MNTLPLHLARLVPLISKAAGVRPGAAVQWIRGDTRYLTQEEIALLRGMAN